MTDTRLSLTDSQLREAWLTLTPTAPAGAEILESTKRQATAFRRRIFRRDLVETLAAALVLGSFALPALRAPGAAPRVGLLLGALCILYPIVKLHRQRRRHRDAAPDAAATAQLRIELARVDDQIQLLESVARWYVTPIALGGTFVMAGAMLAAPWVTSFAIGLVSVLAVALFSALLFGGVGLLVVRLNRRAVETNLRPLRRELLRSLESFESV